MSELSNFLVDSAKFAPAKNESANRLKLIKEIYSQLKEKIKMTKKFKEVFGIELKTFEHIIVPDFFNIIRFDKYLKRVHNNYTKNMSMSDCIKLNYGNAGVEIVNKIINR